MLNNDITRNVVYIILISILILTILTIIIFLLVILIKRLALIKKLKRDIDSPGIIYPPNKYLDNSKASLKTKNNSN